MAIFKWYECSKCHKQGYTNGIPDPQFKGGCYPDGPKGNHEWKFIGDYKDSDTEEYPKEKYDISK